MKIPTILENKLFYSIISGVFTLAIILWDYFHEGVPVHHILASDSMPGFSNWLGLITIPVITWVAITLINKRKDNAPNPLGQNKSSVVLNRFLTAFFFGLVMSVLWELGYEEMLQYLILIPIALSLFWRLFFPEHFLGFVYGMIFTFGGVLPLLFGFIILLLCLFVYKIIRGGFLLLRSKIKM